MPHCIVLYTVNLERLTDLTALCRGLADEMLAIHDETGARVFPTGGTRVLAYPAHHFAVADGQADYAFMYINVRMGAGRSELVQKAVGDRLLGIVKRQLAPGFDQNLIGVTLQVDVSPGQVYDGKHSNLHRLFQK